MNEYQLYCLMSTALRRPCACIANMVGLNHGDVCPKNHHTWRKIHPEGGFYPTHAVAFIGTDQGDLAGIFKINYADDDPVEVEDLVNNHNMAHDSDPPIIPEKKQKNRYIFDTRNIDIGGKSTADKYIIKFYYQMIQKGRNQNSSGINDRLG